MRFLDDSREDFEAEQKAKEEARKRELEQAKALAEAEKKKNGKQQIYFFLGLRNLNAIDYQSRLDLLT